MNYQKFKTLQNLFRKLSKSLIIFSVLSLTAGFFLFSSKTSSQSLPDCSTISGNAEPGINCLFFGLPLCKDVSSPNRRVNCADLIDLPLCSDLKDQTNILVGKNCVKECSDPAFDNANASLVRGSDYAVHNKDCLRFCDSPESGITANVGVNCAARKCSQLPSGVDPSAGVNCDLTACNLLIPDELNNVKFEDSTKKYCEGDDLKCYEFVKAQLPFVRVRAENSMCKIHDCPSACTGEDDTANISDSLKGAGYEAEYKTYITGGYEFDVLCKANSCKPTAHRQYRCLPIDDSNPTTRNSACDSSGDGATCSGGYCYKSIDCNLSTNSDEAECINSDAADEGIIGSTEDTTSSWFYRPKPMDKAVSNGVLINMSNGLCYMKSQMESHGWGRHPEIHIPMIGTIPLGYLHTYVLPDQTRSPGMCDTMKNTTRGEGYIFLCGNGGLLYNKVSDHTAYHRGYVATEYTEENGIHKLVVCLRFKNALRPYDGFSETCGERECAISCTFGVCAGQVCGRDVCKELTVTDENPKECDMDAAMFEGNPGRACSSVIDDYLRVRAVKYNNRICTFLDVKGQTAYPGDITFLSGGEKLSDGTCLAGSVSRGNCNGKNSNDAPTEANKWRAIMRIPYIQNNQASGQARGYLDKNGQLFKEQECIQAALRVGPRRLHNLSTINNAAQLFIPPLYVLNVRTKRGGEIATADAGEYFGRTDFHYPEIEVRFGLNSQKLSLGLGYTGYEEENADSAASATLTTTIGAIGAKVEVFVRKEFDAENYQPTFCLYRKVQNSDGVYLSPTRINCVKRALPEINNAFERSIISNLDPKKLVINADPANNFNSSQIAIKYLGGFGSNNADNNCADDDVCTKELKLNNPDPASPTCDSNIENYKICVQRDECSKINNECAQNEIDLQNAKAAGQSTLSYLAIRQSCNEALLPICNMKKGITSTSLTIPDIINSQPTVQIANAYGWFNELCISSGFNTKLKTVIAYDIDNGLKGKCLINPASPYLTDGNSNTNCNEGGKAPNCLCLEYVDGVSLSSGETSRIQTAHEAGLCIDMPVPKTCAAIDYNPNPNSDSSDLEYVSSSLGKTTYNNSSGVHTSHQARSNGSTHAEFPFAILGMNDVEGECKGFWKNQTSASGAIMSPKLSCLNVDGNGQWSSSVGNECVRYSCPAITTNGPDQSGIYQGNYGINETGENKGLSNGFATWPSHLQSTDFPESVNAAGCISGFKKTGASAITDNGIITGYSGGSSPNRNCNQLGEWQTVDNLCQRITCAAINPTTPTSSTDSAAWTQWSNSGGATFPAANASRSNLRVQAESIAYGTCQESLGFFQASGAPQPSKKCDYLGNWSAVENPCVTHCNSVNDESIAKSVSNGFAYWSEIKDLPLNSEKSTFASSCVSGYVPYPYPPFKDQYGAALTSSVADDLTRAITLPQRTCKSVITAGGTTNVWTGTSSSCINKCPGSGNDSRIGVGKTQHSVANGTITVDWPETDFGQTAFVYSPSDSSQVHVASNYFYGRTNGYYILARYCNANGKWSDPVPQCATNGGEIADPSATSDDGKDSNANYTSSGSKQAVAIGETSPSGSCISGYNKADADTAAISTYVCSYKDSSNKIDQTYFKYNDGKACKKYCSASVGQVFGHAYNEAAASLKDVGEILTLKCNSGYGSPLVYSGGKTSDSNYDCGETAAGASNYTSSIGYRSTNLPYVTCESGGVWSSIYNNCSQCRACDFSKIIGSTYEDEGICDGDKIKFYFDYSWLSGNYGKCDFLPSGDDLSSCSKSVASSIANNPLTQLSLDHDQRASCQHGEEKESCKNGGHDKADALIKFKCVDSLAYVKSLCTWEY